MQRGVYALNVSVFGSHEYAVSQERATSNIQGATLGKGEAYKGAHCYLYQIKQIWDECLLRNCTWFVLTNYHEWTFGAFSSAREAAFVMKPKEYNTLYPTVPELLNWWLASSMKAPNAFTLDTVRLGRAARCGPLNLQTNLLWHTR